LLSLALVMGLFGRGEAAIYVINNTSSFHGMVQNAVLHLQNLGYTVNQGGALGSYAGFEQVWDLRYLTNISAGEAASFTTYLQSGGRMYLTGEHSGFDSDRNVSLVAFLNGVGAGPVTIAGGVGNQLQTITTEGQVVNSPNVFSTVSFNAARTVAETSNGFLVTQTAPGSGQGSLIGWDFGDIVGSPNARMLVGFDIEIFENGQLWTQNMATFLGSASQEAVPEPGTLAMFACGALGLGVLRMRRRRTIA